MLDRAMITDKLHDILEALPYVYAFWLEGADATDTVDEYSDIDYWIDVDDEYVEQAYETVETTLSELASIDYKHIMRKSHPTTRQRIYHLAGTSEYLMIDFNLQLHSRPKNEYVYIENDSIEAVKVIFDKDNIVQYKPLDLSVYTEINNQRLIEAKYRRTQYARAKKYILRGLFLEAYAYYNKYVFEPLIDLLRMIYTPANTDYYLVHISQHIPSVERERLEYFSKIGSLEEIAKKIPQAGEWFDEIVEKVQI